MINNAAILEPLIVIKSRTQAIDLPVSRDTRALELLELLPFSICCSSNFRCLFTSFSFCMK